jgi:hypothetical protein
MLHELWASASASSQTFCLAGPPGDRNRALLEPDAQLIWTVEADNAFDAMTKYYEHMGWGRYKSAFPEVDKQPYAERDDIFPPV